MFTLSTYLVFRSVLAVSPTAGVTSVVALALPLETWLYVYAIDLFGLKLNILITKIFLSHEGKYARTPNIG